MISWSVQDQVSLGISLRAQCNFLDDLLVSHPVPGSACNQEQPIGPNVVTDECSGAFLLAAHSGLTADKQFNQTQRNHGNY